MRKYQYYNTGDDGDRDIYGVNWGGQTFTLETKHLIGKLKLKFFRVSDPKTITISIKNTTGGKPIGGDLCKGTIEGTDITTDTNGEWYEITLGNGAELAKGTQYAIVIRAPDGDASNKLSWRADISAATYTGGTYCGSSDSGIDWSTYSGVDVMFEEWGVGPPSPTTVTWGNLFKSQISTEKIEEAITRMLQDHEDDPNSHVEEGESLYSHKASEIIDHIVRSIIGDKIGIEEIQEQHRHSISAWKRLLAMWPHQALKLLKKTWTGGTGENNAYGLCFDGTYIYVSLVISPGKVIKIDPATMTTVATWTGATGENSTIALTFDGTYIYVGLNIYPAKVIKIDPSDMTTVATWTGAAGEAGARSLTFDGTYIYTGLNIYPAKVIKIDPSDMTTVATWTGAAGEANARSLSFDGNYIYVGLNTDPAKVIKIDTSDMTTSDTWTGAAGENNVYGLTFDGTYIYAALYIDPGKVIQIDPSDMTTIDTWTGAVGETYCYDVTFDGNCIYTPLSTEPGKLIKIDLWTMTTISIWTGATGENTFTQVTFDGNFIYFSAYISPAKVIRKIMRDIDETEV